MFLIKVPLWVLSDLSSKLLCPGQNQPSISEQSHSQIHQDNQPMAFSLFLDFCNLHSPREDLCMMTFSILGRTTLTVLLPGQHKGRGEFISFHFSSRGCQKPSIPPYDPALGAHPPKFLILNFTKSPVSYCLSSLRKEAVGAVNVIHTYRGLKAAEQLSEKGVIAGQRQDPFLGHGAFHIIILQNHVLL